MMYMHSWKTMQRTGVFVAVFFWMTAIVSAGALRVIDYPGTHLLSPQVVLTIYNETDCKIVFTWLPQWRHPSESHYVEWPDLKALSETFWANPNQYFISPYDRFEYVGLIGASPVYVNQNGYIGEWGIGLIPPEGRGVTSFKLWIHGESNSHVTTPYDMEWSAGGTQENVKEWLIGSDMNIPNTKDIKTKLEDRLARYAVQSRLNDKWYIVTLLLGNRAAGKLSNDPSHLVIVIQEANPEMKTVNF